MRAERRTLIQRALGAFHEGVRIAREGDAREYAAFIEVLTEFVVAERRRQLEQDGERT